MDYIYYEQTSERQMVSTLPIYKIITYEKVSLRSTCKERLGRYSRVRAAEKHSLTIILADNVRRNDSRITDLQIILLKSSLLH